MKQKQITFIERISILALKLWSKSTAFVIGLGALVWFIIRVVPKPSRASYPCQQAAFPIASAFVVWLAGTLSSMFIFKKMSKTFANRKLVATICGIASMVVG